MYTKEQLREMDDHTDRIIELLNLNNPSLELLCLVLVISNHIVRHSPDRKESVEFVHKVIETSMENIPAPRPRRG